MADVAERLVLNEDNVANAVGRWLEERGFEVRVITSKQRGYDIDARHPASDVRWVIEAKGATSSKPESRRYGQEGGSAGAYFGTAAAFHNAVAWTGREELKAANIGLALPATRWFNIHSYKLHPACAMMGITVFRVDENGKVSLFPESAQARINECIPRPAMLLEGAEAPPE